jgi:xylan 1,4-beta-xylosidase
MRTIVSLFLMVQFACVFSQSPSFATYTNPVIPGDHSDCTLTQIGNDFYTTGSSFNPTPVIYHSTDLVHWEAVAQPVSAAWTEYGDKPTGGCWGGQIVFHGNKYWHFFSHEGMWFVTALKPEGPWSEPERVKDPPQLPYTLGYDNSIFIDDDDKWYLVVKNGKPNNGIVELGSDGQPTGIVYDLNWLNPQPEFPYSWAEGPVMWKHNGFYYYSFAHDVMGGQKVMRSMTISADKSNWTQPVDFFNEKDPDKIKAIFPGPNHSSAPVLLPDGTSWVVHPVWARANNNEWYGQGRQGLLNQVSYDENNNVVTEYPSDKYFTSPELPHSGIPWMVPKSDFFSSDKLNPEWSFIGQTPNELWSLIERPGWFRMHPKKTDKSNTITKTDAEHNYSLITRLDFDARTISDEAGIRIINGNENLFVKIYSSVNAAGNKIIAISYDKVHFESLNNLGNVIWLKLVRNNHSVEGYYSADGFKWVLVGSNINISPLDKYDIDYNGWCGNRQGLYVQGRSADFDLYIYRDAYTPILAECPANRYGKLRPSVLSTGTFLDNIHNNDWVLYAGVEFRDKDYTKACESIEFSASCITKGSSIEVWLDSIDTGRKIATCEIKNTGSETSFKTFKEPTDPIIGRHDVYLRFIGKTSEKLFLLKSLVFIPGSKD